MLISTDEHDILKRKLKLSRENAKQWRAECEALERMYGDLMEAHNHILDRLAEVTTVAKYALEEASFNWRRGR